MDTETKKLRILIVDDDAEMRATIADLLHNAGFDVDGVDNGAAMRSAMAAQTYALVLLDLRLNAEDGTSLARELRLTTQVPIVMISGASDEIDRVLLLELAADDFLVKPFSPRELLARLRAVLRRTQLQPVGAATAAAEPAPAPPRKSSGGPRVRFGGWTMDLQERELLDAHGTVCALTPAEFRLLEAFIRQPRRVWTRDQLLEHTRSVETDVFDRTIDVLILRLRRKIEPNPKCPQYICTERGVGYVFAAEVTPV